MSIDQTTGIDKLQDISTPYGEMSVEDLAAMLEVTVDYVIHEFLSDR
jgi:hypothetical protein